MKSLGKWFNRSMNDRSSINEMRKQAEEWLKKIDKSGLPGKYKAWCYQHGTLTRLLWPLLIYDVPLTEVESLEKRQEALVV